MTVIIKPRPQPQPPAPRLDAVSIGEVLREHDITNPASIGVVILEQVTGGFNGSMSSAIGCKLRIKQLINALQDLSDRLAED